MSNSTIRAALDDGPRVGEVIELEIGAGDGPPATLVVSDPFSEGPADTTTYHLHQEGSVPGSYVYRTGTRDGGPEDGGGSNDPDDEATDEAAGPAHVGAGHDSEQPQQERMDSEGGA